MALGTTARVLRKARRGKKGDPAFSNAPADEPTPKPGRGKAQPVTGSQKLAPKAGKGAQGGGKGKTGGKAKNGHKKPSAGREALSGADQRLNAEAELEFGDMERSLAQNVARGRDHASTIDRAFDAYRGEHTTALDLHREATRTAASDLRGRLDAQKTAAIDTATGGIDQARADAERTGQATGNLDDVRRQAEASATASRGLGEIQATQIEQTGAAGEGDLGRISTLLGGLQQQLQHANSSRVRDDQVKLGQLGQQKGAFKVKRQGELEQQGFENALARESLIAEGEQAEMDARLKKMGIRAQLAGYETQKDIARIQGKNAKGVARINNKAKGAQAAADRDNALAIARIKESGGSPSKGKHAFLGVNGEVIELNNSQRSDWMAKRTKLSKAWRSAERQIASGKKKDKIIASIAKSEGVPRTVAEAMWAYALNKGLGSRGKAFVAEYMPGNTMPQDFLRPPGGKK